MELRVRADPESVAARHQLHTLTAVHGRNKLSCFLFYFSYLTAVNGSATSLKREGSCLTSTHFCSIFFSFSAWRRKTGFLLGMRATFCHSGQSSHPTNSRALFYSNTTKNHQKEHGGGRCHPPQMPPQDNNTGSLINMTTLQT